MENHNVGGQSLSRKDKTKNPSLVSSGEGSSKHRVFSCRYCNKEYSTARALGGHQNAHKRVKDQERMKNGKEVEFNAPSLSYLFNLQVINRSLDKPSNGGSSINVSHPSNDTTPLKRNAPDSDRFISALGDGSKRRKGTAVTTPLDDVPPPSNNDGSSSNLIPNPTADPTANPDANHVSPRNPVSKVGPSDKSVTMNAPKNPVQKGASSSSSPSQKVGNKDAILRNFIPSIERFEKRLWGQFLSL